MQTSIRVSFSNLPILEEVIDFWNLLGLLGSKPNRGIKVKEKSLTTKKISPLFKELEIRV